MRIKLASCYFYICGIVMCDAREGRRKYRSDTNHYREAVIYIIMQYKYIVFYIVCIFVLWKSIRHNKIR